MGTSAGTHHPNAQRAEDTAKRAGDSHWVDRLARLGLAARGLVYVIVGYIAAEIAFGHTGRQASRQGAFHAIAEKSWGPALLWVMGIGFFGYALWRLTEAIWGKYDEDSDEGAAKKLGKRGFSLFRALVYGFVGYNAISLAMGSGGGGGGGSNGTAQTASAKLLKTSYGVPLLVAIGAAFVVGGAILAYRGVKTKFEKRLKTEQMGERTRKFVEKLGMAGMVARGVIAALIGIFLIESAVTFDPKKAKGLDGSLRTLAQNGWGKFALVLVAIGLVAFGLYSFAEARYRRTGKEKGGSGQASGSGSAAVHDPYASDRSSLGRTSGRHSAAHRIGNLLHRG
jgi:hypothetical protein